MFGIELLAQGIRALKFGVDDSSSGQFTLKYHLARILISNAESCLKERERGRKNSPEKSGKIKKNSCFSSEKERFQADLAPKTRSF